MLMWWLGGATLLTSILFVVAPRVAPRLLGARVLIPWGVGEEGPRAEGARLRSQVVGFIDPDGELSPRIRALRRELLAAAVQRATEPGYAVRRLQDGDALEWYRGLDAVDLDRGPTWARNIPSEVAERVALVDGGSPPRGPK